MTLGKMIKDKGGSKVTATKRERRRAAQKDTLDVSVK
jgi:hypothetical protein